MTHARASESASKESGSANGDIRGRRGRLELEGERGRQERGGARLGVVCESSNGGDQQAVLRTVMLMAIVARMLRGGGYPSASSSIGGITKDDVPSSPWSDAQQRERRGQDEDSCRAVVLREGGRRTCEKRVADMYIVQWNRSKEKGREREEGGEGSKEVCVYVRACVCVCACVFVRVCFCMEKMETSGQGERATEREIV